jgi:hypothetical protein
MNTYKFPKYPNARNNSPWRLDKHIIETEQTLPTEASSIRGTFNGAPATFIRDTERISGDTEFNERRHITGFTVIMDDRMQSFKPENIHLLFSYEGFHAGCTASCHCQTMQDQEYIRHRGVLYGCQECDSRF